MKTEPKTFLQAEEYAYPAGGQTRKGRARFADGKYRRVWAGIPDTFFSIPAHARIAGKYVSGFLTLDDEGVQVFNQYESCSESAVQLVARLGAGGAS